MLFFYFFFLEIANSLAENLHFNTFGGNPLACVAGAAVLDVGRTLHMFIYTTSSLYEKMKIAHVNFCVGNFLVN